MRYVSLFSGIEAASVAWRQLGWELVAVADIDPFACACLAHRFPDVPNLGDVSTIDWSEYAGSVDLVVGGSPCQAFSIAGKRAGLMDERGQLMLEYVRAVRGPSSALGAMGKRAWSIFPVGRRCFRHAPKGAGAMRVCVRMANS